MRAGICGYLTTQKITRSAALVFSVCCLAQTAESAAPDSTNAEDRTLEKVVVTAQRRQENVQEVPISISVLGGDELNTSSFQSMNDALRTVPGVVIYQNGQIGASKVSIRGVSSNTSLLNSGSTVGFYLDEIPFAFVRFPFLPNVGTVYDLERVETLRGPQGTLYGAGSLSGVVRVLTNDANLEEVQFTARSTMSTTEDGDNSYGGDVAVNVPIIPERLAIRATGGYAEDGGWIDQPVAGLKDTNSAERRNVRVKLNAAPTDHLGVELMAWSTRDDSDGRAQSFDDRTSAAGRLEWVDTDMDAYGLTLTYDSKWATLISATSHIDYSTLSAGNNPLGSTSPTAYAYTGIGSELTSQEFRLASVGDGPWRWSAGAIYRDEEDDHLFHLASPTIPASLSGINFNRYGSESYAVFGELSRSFFNGVMEITGGLRYFEDTTYSNEISPLNPANAPFGRREDSFDAITPRLVLTYKPDDAFNFYASYSEGFRSGFSQNATVLRVSGVAAPAGPDRLHNYEVGAKGALFGGRLVYEAAIYYIDWKDTIQTYPVLFGGGLIASPAINSEGVAGPGVDGAISLGLTDHLSVNANVSWNDLEFVADVLTRTATPTIVYPEGSPPPESSALTAGFGVDYTVDLPAGFSSRFSGGANYIDEMVTAAAPGAQSLVGDALTIARASAELIAPQGWRATLFVDNLTDEDGRIRPANPLLPMAGSDRLRPRTIGLQLDFQY